MNPAGHMASYCEGSAYVASLSKTPATYQKNKKEFEKTDGLPVTGLIELASQ